MKHRNKAKLLRCYHESFHSRHCFYDSFDLCNSHRSVGIYVTLRCIGMSHKNCTSIDLELLIAQPRVKNGNYQPQLNPWQALWQWFACACAYLPRNPTHIFFSGKAPRVGRHVSLRWNFESIWMTPLILQWITSKEHLGCHQVLRKFWQGLAGPNR